MIEREQRSPQRKKLESGPKRGLGGTCSCGRICIVYARSQLSRLFSAESEKEDDVKARTVQWACNGATIITCISNGSIPAP
jgi:hypothetical protein